MLPFHLLVWNGDDLEPEQENGKDDGRLKVREDIAGALAARGSAKRTEFETPAGVVLVRSKPVRVEPTGRWVVGSHTHTQTNKQTNKQKNKQTHTLTRPALPPSRRLY